MQKLRINKLGPIQQCEIDIDDFMVFTGPQASGKSTVAKRSHLTELHLDRIQPCFIRLFK